jgi:hypothetical protein
MALPATDTFTGSINDPLSGNWTIDSGNVELNASNQATGQTLSHSFIRWTADAFPDNQYAECNVYWTVGLIAAGPTVRANGTGGGAGYVLQVYDGTVYLQRFSGGGGTFDLLATLGAATSGDLLKLEVSGTTLTPYLNGVSLGPTTDATYASGSAGANFYQTASIDNFNAGALGGGGGAVPYYLLLMGVG